MGCHTQSREPDSANSASQLRDNPKGSRQDVERSRRLAIPSFARGRLGNVADGAGPGRRRRPRRAVQRPQRGSNRRLLAGESARESQLPARGLARACHRHLGKGGDVRRPGGCRCRRTRGRGRRGQASRYRASTSTHRTGIRPLFPPGRRRPAWRRRGPSAGGASTKCATGRPGNPATSARRCPRRSS